jgi:hypothetical protein
MSTLRASCMVQPRDQPSEDRQVGVELHAVDPTDSQGQERPFVLQAAELTLDGSALVVQLNPPWLPRSECTIVPAGERSAIPNNSTSSATWGPGRCAGRPLCSSEGWMSRVEKG